MKGTRREFLTRIAALGGTGALYTAMRMLGVVDDGVAHAQTPNLEPRSGAGRSVIILGAGLAGLSAAFELRKAGYEVRILEARDRVGGRVWSVRRGTRVAHLSGPDQVCDLDDGLYLNAGAARIPSHHQATLGYCREFGVELEVLVNQSYSTRIQSDALNGGRPVQMREAVHGVRGHVASLLAKAVKNGGVEVPLSADDAARLVEMLRGWGGLDPDLAFRHSQYLGYSVEPGAGAVAGTPRDAMTLAALMHPLAWIAPGFTDAMDMQATMFQPVGGMDRIPMAFAERLPGAITLNAEVTRLSRRGGGVEVLWRDKATGQAQSSRADFCLCTIPFPVLKDIRCDLPAARKAAIARTTHVDAFKIAFQSPRFWETEAQIYGGLSFTDRDTFMTWYPSGGFHQPTGVLLAGYTFGDGASRMGAQSMQDRADYARASVDRLHPGKGAALSRPISVHWSQIPYARGMSAEMARSDAEGYGLMSEPEGPILFAGEHLSHVGPWQQGAIVSAWRAVGQIDQQARARAA